jgi:phenylacetic acid degradation operon negative regulatory protein
MTHDRNAADAPPVPRTTPAERPLTARSVLASALLGSDPPELSVARLVRLAGLFAINENRARVALSRMVAAGEVTTDGSGRYRLAGDLLARQSRQQVSRLGGSTAWDGQWWIVVITASATAADARTARRKALHRSRLAELREGVWMRPSNLALDLPDTVRSALTVMHGRPDTDERALSARLWGLPAWNDHAEELIRRLDRTPPHDASVLAPGFVLSASVLRHLQSDPLLPDELLPDGWLGSDLRAAYDTWDVAYRGQLAEWHRTDTP